MRAFPFYARSAYNSLNTRTCGAWGGPFSSVDRPVPLLGALYSQTLQLFVHFHACQRKVQDQAHTAAGMQQVRCHCVWDEFSSEQPYIGLSVMLQPQLDITGHKHGSGLLIATVRHLVTIMAVHKYSRHDSRERR